MISKSNLEQQLKRIHFNRYGWGRSEAAELCNVLMPSEEIDECVNGFYESGFALLVATKDRLLLIDKKPLNYLMVEDMRFDMICEFDYSHRLLGAEVRVATSGNKTLHFTSWNQPRLRRLLGYVQFRITETKKLQQSHQEAQQSRLDQMSQQLQLFLAVQQYYYHRQIVPAYAAPSPFPIDSTSMTARTDVTASQGSNNRRFVSAGQIGLAAMKRVVPVIGAYTRLPRMDSWQRRHEVMV